MMFVLLGLTAVVRAAEPPCYGHTHDNRVDTEHFWIEWQDGVLDQDGAEALGEVMEGAWRAYVDDLGWQAPVGSIVVAVQNPLLGEAAGRTLSFACDHGHQPKIELYPVSWENGSDYWEVVAPHELHHALQYVTMGSAPDSIASWLWFMEGTATWSEMYADHGTTDWAVWMRRYLDTPHLSLHHGGEGFLSPDTSNHMYGTAVLVRYIDEHHGGPDTVRALWEYGATVAGERIWFPDAVEAIGIDFDAFWSDYIARLAVLDMEIGDTVGETLTYAERVSTLPAEGEVPEAFQPQGLGVAAVRFGAPAGKAGHDLQVRFEGSAEASWHVVLVRTDGAQPGSRVIETVALDTSGGTATGVLEGFDGSHPAYLVASPEIDATEGQPFSFSAELVEGETPKGCACGQGAAWGDFSTPLLGLFTRR